MFPRRKGKLSRCGLVWGKRFIANEDPGNPIATFVMLIDVRILPHKFGLDPLKDIKK
jgi:hypothetical protein